jgi:hypothetical protein
MLEIKEKTFPLACTFAISPQPPAHTEFPYTGFPYPDNKKAESILSATFTDLVSDKMTTATWFAGLPPLLKINSGDIREYLPGLDFTGSRIPGIFWRR